MQDISKRMQRQLTGLSVALIVEFLLGVALTTVINYNPDAQNTVQTVVLIAHIVVGVGIVIGAVAWLVTSMRQRVLRGLSVVGLLSVLGAFASGSASARTGSSVEVFVMAILFIVAFVIYGYSMVTVTRQAASVAAKR
jgi:predicted Na+-dependent transporter